MTYAQAVRYLETQAKAAGAASFWFGAQVNQDINYNAPFPQALLFLMPAPLVGANVQYQVTLQFVGNDQHEYAANLADPTVAGQSLDIQDEMDVLSQRFISGLKEDDQFDLPERIDRGAVLRKGTSIGTGFLLSFTLTGRSLVC
jgi:hypothetical protein